MKILNSKINDFLQNSGLESFQIKPIAGDASSRQYYRLTKNTKTLILMDSSSSQETIQSFFDVREFLEERGYSVPQLIEYDLNKGILILEDLGLETLDLYLRDNAKEHLEIYDAVINLLISFQKLNYVPFPNFDKTFFLQELTYFTDWYMPYIGKTLTESGRKEFNKCWEPSLDYIAEKDNTRVFVHKDLHCGNLFWIPERNGVQRLGVIDFQGGKSGSVSYDITSFLNDCRNPLPYKLRCRLLDNFRSKIGLEKDTFKNICDIYVAQRNIKILGNFTGIYQREGKSTYMKFIPNSWTFIMESFKNPLLQDVKDWFIRHNVNLKFMHQERLY